MNFQPLKDFLDYYLPMLGVPGSDTVIYKDHEEIFRYQSGFDNLRLRTPVRPDALYHMYSCTKVATMTAVMQLVERGEILLSDPLYAYFPEYRDMMVEDRESGVVRPANNPILIRHLLTMTAGFDYNKNRPAIRRVIAETEGRAPTLEVVRALASEPLCFDPGTRYQYSLCHDIAAGLVELVSGKRYSEYLKENVFEPLGMYNTYFGMNDNIRARLATQYNYNAETKSAIEIPIDENPYRLGTEYDSGGAGIISCVDDMILLADALTNLGEGKNGNRVLSSAAVTLMRRNQLSPEILPGFAQRHHLGYGYGLGVRTNLDPAAGGNLASVGEFGWDGAKCSYLSCDPATGVALFHAEHMGGLHSVLLPRLRNVVCACVDAD